MGAKKKKSKTNRNMKNFKEQDVDPGTDEDSVMDKMNGYNTKVKQNPNDCSDIS